MNSATLIEPGHRTVAIIPARGGSKGIPQKNLIDFAGKSMIVRCIEAATLAKTIDSVVVSTDDNEIGKVSAQHGAEVIRRPAYLAGDTASSESALLHTLEYLAAQGREFDTMVFLQCTSPMTTATDIEMAIFTKASTHADCVLSVTPFHHFLWKCSSEGMQAVNHDASVRKRRQECERQFRENGAIYVMDVKGFQKHRHRFFGRIAHFEMPESRSWEIDTYEDLAVAELLYRNQSSGLTPALSSCRAMVFDFDGVLTENGVWVDQEGNETVRCDRRDGFGFELARYHGLKTLILSKERNPVVVARAKKLQCEIIHGVDDKLTVLQQWLFANEISWSQIAYVGNDLNDLDCIKKAGFGISVSDAQQPVRAAADWVTTRPGGQGAVREVIDRWIASQP